MLWLRHRGKWDIMAHIQLEDSSVFCCWPKTVYSASLPKYKYAWRNKKRRRLFSIKVSKHYCLSYKKRLGPKSFFWIRTGPAHQIRLKPDTDPQRCVLRYSHCFTCKGREGKLTSKTTSLNIGRGSAKYFFSTWLRMWFRITPTLNSSDVPLIKQGKGMALMTGKATNEDISYCFLKGTVSRLE